MSVLLLTCVHMLQTFCVKWRRQAVLHGMKEEMKIVTVGRVKKRWRRWMDAKSSLSEERLDLALKETKEDIYGFSYPQIDIDEVCHRSKSSWAMVDEYEDDDLADVVAENAIGTEAS